MADVPNVPGVPPLPSFAPFTAVSLMTGDIVTGYGSRPTPQWGLYVNGVPVIVADSVTAMGFRVEWAISKYPLEDGAFESYDRVDQPFECHLQFVSGKNNANRQALLRSLDAATADGNLTKYDVVTPEVVYSGVNIDHIDYDRKAAHGLGILIVDVMVQQIREQNNPAQNGKVPSANAPVSDGNVQPTAPATGAGGIGVDFAGDAKNAMPAFTMPDDL